MIRKATVAFSLLALFAAQVIYSGTVNEDSEISGTLDIGGGLLTGTFTAVRAEA